MVPKIPFFYSAVYDRQLLALTGIKVDDGYFSARKKKAEKFIADFQSYEKIMELMNSFAALLNSVWKENITIYVIPNFHGTKAPLAFSDPTTISLEKSKEGQTIELTSKQIFLLIAHELAHVAQKQVSINLSNFNAELYLVRNHIITYALLQKTLPPELFEIEVKKSKKNAAYDKAMQIVLAQGSDKLIREAIGK